MDPAAPIGRLAQSGAGRILLESMDGPGEVPRHPNQQLRAQPELDERGDP